MAAAFQYQETLRLFDNEPILQQRIAEVLNRIDNNQSDHSGSGSDISDAEAYSPAEIESAAVACDPIESPDCSLEHGHQSPMVRVFRVSHESDPDLRDRDSGDRLRSVMKAIRKSGETRPLALPKASAITEVDELAIRFPNFQAVITAVLKPHIAITLMGIHVRMPPVLLVGAPGIGKTAFATAASEMLNVPLLKFDMSTETNGAALAGSSTFWSNSNHGAVFDVLLRGAAGKSPVANPICFIDEIDKAGPSLTYDPLGACYSLLEVESASRFVDQSVPGVEVDTSHVRWLFAANHTSSLPEPILSRMLIFHIPTPSGSSLETIIARIAQKSSERFGGKISAELPDVVKVACMSLSPRVSKLRLDAAFSIAVSKGEQTMSIDSWRMACAGIVSPGRLPGRLGFL